MKQDDLAVEIFHRINKLRQKAGLESRANVTGTIDTSRIKNAQKMIDEKEEEYPVEVKNILTELQKAWSQYQNSSEDVRDELLEKIYNYSNNIKDLTSMYQHDLMSHFSLSLREFCEKLDAEKPEHQTIVQAHINVMWVTYEQQLRSEETNEAEELKKIVALAIKKYS